jgi:hypothetical protein
MRWTKSTPAGEVWAKKPFETMSCECTRAACWSFGLWETGPTPPAARCSFTRQRSDSDIEASVWSDDVTSSFGQAADAAAGATARTARPVRRARGTRWRRDRIPSHRGWDGLG